jgi:prevent-host-death family protein
MKMNAKDAQAHFGEMMSIIRKEPVTITKYGKETAVVISYEEYQKFQNLEDLYWSLKAEEAEKEGYLSSEDTKSVLDSILKSKYSFLS